MNPGVMVGEPPAGAPATTVCKRLNTKTLAWTFKKPSAAGVCKAKRTVVDATEKPEPAASVDIELLTEKTPPCAYYPAGKVAELASAQLRITEKEK